MNDQLKQTQFKKRKSLKGFDILTCSAMEWSFPPHLHEQYCIWINSAGGEWLQYKGTTDILEPGGFGIVNPGEIHANKGVGGRGRRLQTLYIDAEVMNNKAVELGGKGGAAPGFSRQICRDPELFNLLRMLHHTLESDADVMELEVLYTRIVSMLLIRHGDERLNICGRIQGEAGRAARVIEYMSDHLIDNITLQELADISNCTSYHLIRLFKKETGISPHAYLVQKRIETAKRLLSNGSSIVNAAQDAGFTDQAHFTRKFKQSYGITPGEYRRQVSGL